VIARHPDRFHVVAMTARQQWQLLLEQAVIHRPQLVVLVDGQHAQDLERGLRQRGLATEVLTGHEALDTAATLVGADCVMAAIVGAAGLARLWPRLVQGGVCSWRTKKHWSCRGRY
jgi:1-deoxy-D-xylulose-5-phosphate reductoisomerase